MPYTDYTQKLLKDVSNLNSQNPTLPLTSQEYNYNAFDPNVPLDDDSSYLGIMASDSDGISSAQTIKPYSYENIELFSQTSDYTNSFSLDRFTLANCSAIKLSPDQFFSIPTSNSKNTASSKTSTENGKIKEINFDLQHTSATVIPAPFGQLSTGSASDKVESGFTGYKLDKDTDGKYKPTFYENGEKISQADFMVKHKKEYAACKKEMEEKNKTSS